MRTRSALLLNALTVLLLAAALALGGTVALLVISPEAAPPPLRRLAQIVQRLNPTAAPPSTAAVQPPAETVPPAVVIGPARTRTPAPVLSPSNALLPSPTGASAPASPQLTLAPTLTLTLTPTPTGPTPTASLTPIPPPFGLQEGHPVYTRHTVNESGCEWLGVAGQAVDLAGQPIIGLTIILEGAAPDPQTAVTGSALAHGPGGYEFILDNRPKDTAGVFRIQLATVSLAPLSESFPFDTVADCDRNLVLINFVQTR